MHSFYSPLAVSAPFYGYLKLLKLHRTERSRNKDVRSGNQTQDFLHQGRTLTDCAILAPRIILLHSRSHTILSFGCHLVLAQIASISCDRFTACPRKSRLQPGSVTVWQYPALYTLGSRAVWLSSTKGY